MTEKLKKSGGKREVAGRPSGTSKVAKQHDKFKLI